MDRFVSIIYTIRHKRHILPLLSFTSFMSLGRSSVATVGALYRAAKAAPVGAEEAA